MPITVLKQFFRLYLCLLFLSTSYGEQNLLLPLIVRIVCLSGLAF